MIADGRGWAELMGPSRFTSAEVQELRRLLREKQTADRDRQKALRRRMRAIGFYISDFHHDAEGFTVSDLNALVERGVVTVADDDFSATAAPPESLAALVLDGEDTAGRAHSPEAAPAPASPDQTGARAGNELVAAALLALTRPRHTLMGGDPQLPAAVVSMRFTALPPSGRSLV